MRLKMSTPQCGWSVYLLFLYVFYGTTEEDTLSVSDINQFNEESNYMSWVRQSLEWQYSTNMSARSADELREFQEKYSSWLVSWKTRARRTDTRQMDPRHRRMIHLLSSGVVFTDPLMSRQVSDLRTRLSRIYAEGYIDIPNLGIRRVKGEDGTESLMGSTGNPNLLAEIWRQWQSSVGRPVRSLFLELVTLLNQSARENGYNNYGEVWKEELDVDNVEQEALRLWSEVKGFYEELRLYVQRRLYAVYGSSYLNISGAIPVPVLGSLWGYNWKNLESLVLPFPEESSTSDGALVDDPKDLVKISEDFYSSLGLPPMTKAFWKKSMFTRPTDGRVVDCHGVAFDFQRDSDFRMKVCLSRGNTDELKTVFHEMGHVMYFMAYRHLPAIFRNSPNSAFHETIGDTVAMGALSPQCSERVINRESVFKGSNRRRNLMLKILILEPNITSLTSCRTLGIFSVISFSFNFWNHYVLRISKDFITAV